MSKIIRQKKEEGSVFVIVALFLPVILALLALLINSGIFYYIKSTQTGMANRATASAMSVVADKMTEIVNEKIKNDPTCCSTATEVWENLSDEDRIFLTQDPQVRNQVEETLKEYLQKNMRETMPLLRNAEVKELNVAYPYNYNLADRFLKLHLNFTLAVPLVLQNERKIKDVTVEAESQIRIK